jgi:general secretion pathway protein C
MGIVMNINFNNMIKQSLVYISTILIAFIISSVLYIYLPKTAPIVIDDQKKPLKYNKYQVKKSFKEKQNKIIKKAAVVRKTKEYQLINNIILKAIFALSNNKGFIMIAEKSSSVSHTLKVGDVFKNYKLKSIYPSYVIFTKGTNEYKLTMDNEENKSTKYTVEKVDLKKSIKDEINKVDSGYILKKSIINKYTKNFDNIWKEIAIKEIKKDGKIDGFKIGNLSSKSVFKKLGLKIGDIIKSVNNITLTSYAQAFKIYENMDNITNLHIVLERNNKQMELDYEIK